MFHTDLEIYVSEASLYIKIILMLKYISLIYKETSLNGSPKAQPHSRQTITYSEYIVDSVSH